MGAELVIDASLAAKCLLPGVDSDRAREAVRDASWLIAPELVFPEAAHVTARYLRRGLIDREAAGQMLHSLRGLLDEVQPCSRLAERAFAVAIDHGFSVYDAHYVALAEERRFTLASADAKLIHQAAARLSLQVLLIP